MGKSTSNGYAGAYFQTNEAEVITAKIYGVRYPDGTIRWDGNGSKTCEQAATSDVGKAHWVNVLHQKAKELHLDPETYADSHALVSRTVIIAAAAAEEV